MTTIDAQPDPLHAWHEAAGGEFQPYGAVELVASYGATPLEYAALRKTAGIIDWPQRDILELTGTDRLDFLNRMLTNQLLDEKRHALLASGQGIYSFLLNIKGRIVADMNVLELGDRTWLELDGRVADGVLKTLQPYVIMDDVNIRRLGSSIRQVGLYGPDAIELATKIGFQVLELPVNNCVVSEGGGIAWRDDPTGTPGINLAVPVSSALTIWQTLVDAGARPTGWGAFNAVRIEAGRPLFGIDFDESMLPAETGQLERAVSMTKGCYLGQEVVARMHARAQVARQIVGIRMTDDALPLAGTQIFDEAGNAIGGVTSSTISPVLSNASVALALLKKGFTAVGTKLSVPAEGKLRVANVVAIPFV